VLKAIVPHSGHYRPTASDFDMFVRILADMGVPMAEVQCVPFKNYTKKDHARNELINSLISKSISKGKPAPPSPPPSPLGGVTTDAAAPAAPVEATAPTTPTAVDNPNSALGRGSISRSAPLVCEASRHT
jgi:hypothetical protein